MGGPNRAADRSPRCAIIFGNRAAVHLGHLQVVATIVGEDRMFKRRHRATVAALGLAVGLIPTIGKGQEIDIAMALPASTLTFSAAFIAEDAGFYKQERLKVTNYTIVGVGSVN